MSGTGFKEIRIKNKVFVLVPKELHHPKGGSVEATQYSNKSIGRNLKSRREAVGLTQMQLAKRARIRPEMISRIENGHGNPTVATVKKIVETIEQWRRKRDD